MPSLRMIAPYVLAGERFAPATVLQSRNLAARRPRACNPAPPRAISMTSVMAIIQEWPAETSTAPRRRGAAAVLIAVAILAAAVSAGAQQIGNQGSSTLELPTTRHQTQTLPQSVP